MPVLVRFTAIRANARVIPAAEIATEIKFFVKDYMDDIVGKATDPYPAPPPSPPNTYVRTGRYALYMVSKNTSSPPNIQYTISNPVQDARGRYYAGYVGGSNQTWFHRRDGWKVVASLVNRTKLEAGVQRIIEGRSVRR